MVSSDVATHRISCERFAPDLDLFAESGIRSCPLQIGIRIQMWEVQRPGAVPFRKNSFLIIFMKKAVNFIFKNS
jgi:hypothetical protein